MAGGIIKPIITIGLNAEGKMTMVGPLNDKPMCMLILADAIKMVVAHQEKEPSPILTPPGAGQLVGGGA